MKASLARRLTLALAVLLLAFGLFVAGLVRHVGLQQEEVGLQRLSHGLAAHIVNHWPAVRSAEQADRAARGELLRMLMTVNPGIQVYLLDADGLVDHYIGEPGMVRTPVVDLAPVRAYLAGAPAPVRGTDPMGGPPRSFSAAMFPPLPARAGQSGAARPPGYLYIVLPAPATAQPDAQAPLWESAAWAVAAAVLATLFLGIALVRHLTRPLQHLAQRLQAYGLIDAQTATASGQTGIEPGAGIGMATTHPNDDSTALATGAVFNTSPVITGSADTTTFSVRPSSSKARPARHEIDAIAKAFDAMAERVSRQVLARGQQDAAHREVMANVAHDLRTPLTALHGHLEALATPGWAEAPARRQSLLKAALAQSDKVRRLSQQLFELATLQSTHDLPQRERFRLDELVADTVQKFDPGLPQATVALCGPAPAAVLLDGDLHLIERALSNLIDNAVRHAPGARPVQVSLQSDGQHAQVLVADGGPGLPAELARRLDADQPVREPPLPRPGGGVGGLGLAIAQRIALLHGGSLRVQHGPGAGTRLVLALPLARPAA